MVRILALAAVLLAAAGYGVFLAARPAPPPIPEIDLTRADDEVASEIQAAVNGVKSSPQ